MLSVLWVNMQGACAGENFRARRVCSAFNYIGGIAWVMCAVRPDDLVTVPVSLKHPEI